MAHKNKTLNFNKSFIHYALILLPIIAVVIKDIIFQGYLFGDNFFVLNIGKALGGVGVYWLMHILCFAFIFSFALLFRNRGAYVYTMLINIFFSVLLLVYLIYLRCFSTLPSLGALRLMFVPNGDIPSDASNMVWPITYTDLILAWDFVIWFVLYFISLQNRKTTKKLALAQNISTNAIAKINAVNNTRSRKKLNIGFACALIISTIGMAVIPIANISKDENYNPRHFDVKASPITTAKTLSPIGYMVTDIVELMFMSRKPTQKDKADIKEFFDWNKSDYFINEHFGALQGKNLIVIQVESLESFVIGNAIDGQEITPNINKLLGKSYRFDVHDQVSGGNSSDCDLLLMSSLLPSKKFATFEKFSHNAFNSLPLVLERKNYNTFYYDGTADSVWGYEKMVRNGMKFQTVDFKYDLSDKLNTYISDESYLRQTLQKMIKAGSGTNGENFYAHMVMCSSHAPFKIPKELQLLNLPLNLKNNVMGDYMQSVHYADKQIGMFINGAKDAGILDNSVVAIVGDHLGLHKYYVEVVNNLEPSAQKDWFAKNYDGTVPAIIYDYKSESAKEFKVEGGQVDIMPTILYLLGVEKEEYWDTAMGRSLVATNRNFAFSGYGKLYGTYSRKDEKIIRRMPYISDRLLVSDYFRKR